MRLILILPLILITTSALARSPGPQASRYDQDDDEPLRPLPPLAGRVAESSVGKVGQRQTREQSTVNVAPMSRIASRIQNRVQSRIQNRIDRNYDARADAASPFAAAADQVRVPIRPQN